MSENNCIKLDNFLEYGLEVLKSENQKGHYDENKLWEDIACGILNLAFTWNLQNLNETQRMNYPAIDLGDDNLGIGVQVSTDCKPSTINDKLSKLTYKENGIQICEVYNNIYYFVPGYNSSKYKEDAIIVPDGVIFDKSHIIDFSAFKVIFSGLNDYCQDQILEILETELHIRPSYELISYPNNLCDYIPGSRKAEMVRIEEEFKRSKNVFLWGLGGIGKTELAAAWGQEKRRQGENVYFVHYRGSIVDTVCNMEFTDFQYIEKGTYKNDSERKMAQFRKKIEILRKQYSKATIIIDNFDKDSPNVTWADMLNQEGYAELISLNTKFLFTTRFEVKTSAIPVRELSMDILLTLFKENAKNTITPQQVDKVEELINLVDRHTLTVDLMSKSLYFGYDITIDSLIRAFKESTLDKSPLPLIDAAHNSETSDFEYHEMRILGHLKKLFEISNLDANQRNVMRHAFLLPEAGMDFQRFCKCQSEAENDTMKQFLLRRNWLQANPEHTYLSMHSVIRQVCYSELTFTNDNCATFLHNLMDTTQASESQPVLKPAYDTIIRAAEILEDQLGEWHYMAGKYSRLLGCYDAAKDYLEKAANRAESTNNNPKLLANILNESVKQHMRALELIKDTDEPEFCAKIHHDLGNAYSYLAEEKRDKSIFYKSLDHLNQSKDINIASTHINAKLHLSDSIHVIGNVYAKIGKVFHDQYKQANFEKALENHQEALRLRLEIPNVSIVRLARSYNSIGNDYANLNNNEKALDYRSKALEYTDKTLVDNHPDKARRHSNIAHSYQQLRNYPSAIEQYEKAISIYEKSLPQELKNLVKCEYHLMQIYWERSNSKQIDDLNSAKENGERAYKHVQKLQDKKLSEAIRNLLGEIYGCLGDEKNKQRILTPIEESTSREDIYFSKKRLSRLRNLAYTAWKNSDFINAKQYYADLYEYEIKFTSEQHDNIINTLFFQGLVADRLHDYDSSLLFFIKAKELYDAHAEASHFRIQKIQKNIQLITKKKQKSNKK